MRLLSPAAAVAVLTLGGCSSAPRPLPPLQLTEGQREPSPTPAPPAVTTRDLLLFAAPAREDLTLYAAGNNQSGVAFATPDDAESHLATSIYGYRPGTVYQVRTTPGFLTTVVFEAGERITHLGSGDSDRWLFQEVKIGDGDTAEATLLIKPSVAPLVTNLVITTDRRLYQMEVLADEKPDPDQSLVKWRYAGASLARRGLRWEELSTRPGDTPEAAEEDLVDNSIAVDLDRLDFEYEIRVFKGKSPRWKPVSVFNDGSKTYIRFPQFFDQTEAPAVFSRTGEEDQLVNFRVVDGLYVIDRVLDVAVLKLGKKKQDVVMIEYTGDFFGDENR